ncbi:MAG TPA: acyl carrier protein [Thermotogota bacterium]|jgi:acyl carrier protein|nr:acyl carrier protein [Thermotogota bacterium]HOZ13112.1 acyl carrier protein [Thermotogota bacterium]HPB87494.1 acyl carrier protein [Thermotogota bacterium]HPM22212.1 acyl carrier protein [Thermotogota bacterium]HQQ65781.1 acyl carrier protein [Thermotogota bacterium]
MEEKIIQWVSSILHVKVTRDSSRGNTEQWDSLRHLQIIAGLEEEFGIDIPIDKVAEILSVSDILRFAESGQ